jgi:hypothetical protein
VEPATVIDGQVLFSSERVGHDLLDTLTVVTVQSPVVERCRNAVRTGAQPPERHDRHHASCQTHPPASSAPNLAPTSHAQTHGA